jgi:hypothetical protein
MGTVDHGHDLGRGEVSPRPVLSPSNLNSYAENEGRHGESLPSSQPHSPATAASNNVGRSPRDRMKIDHLLGSPRSPWSPRSLMGRSAGMQNAPPRFTSQFHSNLFKSPFQSLVAEFKGPDRLSKAAEPLMC